MFKMRTTILLAILIVAATVVGARRESDQKLDDAPDDASPKYENPVRSGDNDEIKVLPGLNEAINFRQFSGYLQADEVGDRFNHYWLVESQSDPTNDPLVLWLNGGPGCSSLGGLFTELGPFSVEDGAKTLKLNEFSWNKVANVLFLESPSAVGFSYSLSSDNYDDDITARENYHSLRSFMRKFPQYKKRALYITGESYAGVYLPTLGVLLEPESEELNFKGVAIGNGYLDVEKLSNSLNFFTYHHGFAGKSSWQALSKFCCGGKPPSREDCFNLATIDEEKCNDASIAITTSLSGLADPYNVYSDCMTDVYSSQHQLDDDRAARLREISREKMGRILSISGLLNLKRTNNSTVSLSLMLEEFDRKVNDYKPTCANGLALKNYLNSVEVLDAIHIPKKIRQFRWSDCRAFEYGQIYPWKKGGLSPQIKQLVNSKRNLTMLIYNGDVDSVCNFLGDEWFADDLGLAVRQNLTFWKVDNQIAGAVKHYDGLTFATVRGSGHMVPEDKPREALRMFKMFLESSSLSSEASSQGNVLLEQIE